MDTEPAHCPVSAPEAGDHCWPFAWWNWLLPCGQNPAYTAPSLIRGTRGAGLPGFWVHGGHPHPLRDTCCGQCQLLQDRLTHHPLCLAARGASGWRGSPGCPPLCPSPTATAGASPRTRLPPGVGLSADRYALPPPSGKPGAVASGHPLCRDLCTVSSEPFPGVGTSLCRSRSRVV